MATLTTCALSAYLLITIGSLLSLCRAARTRPPCVPQEVIEFPQDRGATPRKLDDVCDRRAQPAAAVAHCTARTNIDLVSKAVPDSGADHVTLAD